ncbi:MAG: recombinase family protein [Hymenobacter sp.]|nr:MAG: recombinase family protein [Hymenobacter sp.]
MQHTFGYARVSATDQNLATQVEDLTQAGCTRIFQEKVSGTRTSSLALTELLAAVREGDIVVVNRLARLGRNTVHTIQLVEEFNRRGVHFRALDLGIDSRTPAGKMIIGVFSSFNQYERENKREKSLAGIGLAKQQGKHLGRPAGRDAEKLTKVTKALEKGLSVAEIVTLTGISRASVKRYRQELEG